MVHSRLNPDINTKPNIVGFGSILTSSAGGATARRFEFHDLLYLIYLRVEHDLSSACKRSALPSPSKFLNVQLKSCLSDLTYCSQGGRGQIVSGRSRVSELPSLIEEPSNAPIDFVARHYVSVGFGLRWLERSCGKAKPAARQDEGDRVAKRSHVLVQLIPSSLIEMLRIRNSYILPRKVKKSRRHAVQMKNESR